MSMDYDLKYREKYLYFLRAVFVHFDDTRNRDRAGGIFGRTRRPGEVSYRRKNKKGLLGKKPGDAIEKEYYCDIIL